jgi:filamentous hemagglutinin family protein (fragment)
MVMVFNVEGTPVYSSYNIEGGVSAFVGAYTMGRGYLEDPQGNIVTDPEILKEQLTGFSMGWSAGFGLEHGRSTNVNGYSFIYNAVSSTPTISLSAGYVFYEGNQKDF